MRAFAFPDLRFVGLAAGGLAIAGGAAAFAELRLPSPPKQKPAVLVATERVQGDAVAGGRPPAALRPPPSGRFASAFALLPDPEAERAPENRFDAAFGVFDAMGPPGAVGAASLAAALIRPGDPLMPSPPRAKPAFAAPPVQVASLEASAPATPRAASPALAQPVLASEGAPKKMPKGAAPFLDLIRREAKANGVPLWVALGVIWVESKFDPNLRGSHGVLGMMQVMPSTARYLGYKGSNADLLKPEVNVTWGMKELSKDIRYARGELCLAVAKYKGGFMTKRINAGAQRYCDQLRRVTGMDGVAMVPVPTGPDPKFAKN